MIGFALLKVAAYMYPGDEVNTNVLVPEEATHGLSIDVRAFARGDGKKVTMQKYMLC